MHFSLVIQRHIHANELLVGQPVGALGPEAQRRVHVLQHVVHLRVENPAGGARVVLGPNPQELVQVVGAQNGRVPGQVVEVVHDDGHEQIEHEERAQEDERHEVGVSEVRAAEFWVVFAGRLVEGHGDGVAGAAVFAGEHDARPGLSGGASKVHVHSFAWIIIPSGAERSALFNLKIAYLFPSLCICVRERK